MKIIDIITLVDETYPNTVGDGVKVGYINDLERDIFNKYLREIEEQKMDLTSGTDVYDLPNGYLFENIEKINIDGRNFVKSFIFDNTYFEFYKVDQHSFGINPTPTKDLDDGIKIFLKKQPELKTKELMSSQEPSLIKMFGNQWKRLYEFYIKHEIAIDLKENSDANNFAIKYNQAENDFVQFYYSNLPNTTANRRKKAW